MLLCLIDSMENQDVATVDFPGQFMQAYLDDKVMHLRLYSKVDKLVISIDPNGWAILVLVEGRSNNISQIRNALIIWDFEAWKLKKLLDTLCGVF